MAAPAKGWRGGGVDGGPDIDPTKNVIDLVEAGMKRQDDLRLVQAKHTEFVAKLRAKHAAEIRKVDLVNSKAEWDRSQQAIQALAATNKTDAENLRNALNATAERMAKQTTDLASTIATTTSESLRVITARIGELEKASYKGEGKSLVADPALESFKDDIRKLLVSGNRREGKSEGISASWAILIAVVGLLGTLISGGAALYAFNRTSGAAPTGQVIYLPSTPLAVTPTSPKGSP